MAHDFTMGFDCSTLAEVERCGGRFFDEDGKQGDLLAILARHGADCIRLRLWNDPYDASGRPYGAGTCDEACVLELARRAKELGLSWMLCLHYSDFWADPWKQYAPKAWRGMGLEGLEQAVYEFTSGLLVRFVEEGLEPAFVECGNEVTAGLLWPVGKPPAWEAIHRLIAAGHRAVRERAPRARLVVHLDKGGNNEICRPWFERFFEAGGECDVIGLSYYPFWDKDIDGLRENLLDLARRFGKDIMIVETSSAFSLESYAAFEGLPEDGRMGPAVGPKQAEGLPWDMTPEGQAQYVRDIMDVLAQVPDGHGAGLFWWEAGWVPVPGSGWATPESIAYMQEKGTIGNEWANQALFDYEGHALPALAAMRDYLKR